MHATALLLHVFLPSDSFSLFFFLHGALSAPSVKCLELNVLPLAVSVSSADLSCCYTAFYILLLVLVHSLYLILFSRFESTIEFRSSSLSCFYFFYLINLSFLMIPSVLFSVFSHRVQIVFSSNRLIIWSRSSNQQWIAFFHVLPYFFFYILVPSLLPSRLLSLLFNFLLSVS